MTLLPTIRKLILLPVVGFCVLVVLALLASQIEQHIFRSRADRLLSDIQSIELRKTTWQEAQARVQKWSAQSRFSNPCDAHKCSIEIELDEFVMRHFFQNNPFERLDNYLRWRFKLSSEAAPLTNIVDSFLRLYMRAGGRPSAIRAHVGMRDAIIWSKGFTVDIATHSRISAADPNSYSFTLEAELESTPRISDEMFILPWVQTQLRVHPEYEIGRPGGCEGCVIGWVKFTPFAPAQDIQRLMVLNLSCLTRLEPCVSQAEIMPNAWAQYLAEKSDKPYSKSASDCAPNDLLVIGRDSPLSLIAEILDNGKAVVSEDADYTKAKVRALMGLKGESHWRDGEVYAVRILTGQPCGSPKVSAGSKWILFGLASLSGVSPSNPELTWAGIPLTETNLKFFRQGVEQDFSSGEDPAHP